MSIKGFLSALWYGPAMAPIDVRAMSDAKLADTHAWAGADFEPEIYKQCEDELNRRACEAESVPQAV